MDKISIKGWSAWAPEIQTREDWRLWAYGQKELTVSGDKPKLGHLPPVARRRLSQLTKMVLHVGHELLSEFGSCKTVFCSRFGEIGQQNKITGDLIDSGEVRPAAFSLSVFNTPVSQLSIHEENIQPSTVLLSGKEDLSSGLAALLAELRLTPDQDVLLVFGDEMLPEDYQDLHGEPFYPYAFGIVVGIEDKSGSGIELDCQPASDAGSVLSPLDFLKWMLCEDRNPFCVSGSGLTLTLRKNAE